MKKVKIIVFILMILSSILPLAGVIIPWAADRGLLKNVGSVLVVGGSSVQSIGLIGGADGPTAIYLGAGSALPVIGPFVPTILLFVLGLILHSKTRKNN